MTATTSYQFWDLLGGVFSLSLEAFQEIASLQRGILSSVLVVIFAGLSLAIGQSIVLFINRVKPIRFVFSLLLNAILFTFGFLFLAFSTWLICLLPWSVDVSFRTLIKVFGFSYAPQLFSFLGALPYAGLPILNVLSVWRLLAAVVGFEAAAGVDGATAFGYVAFGWVALQFLEGSIGQPIARLGQTLADRVAGVELVENRTELIERVQAGRVAAPIVAATQTTAPEMNRLIQTSGRSAPEAAQAVAQAVVNNVGSTCCYYHSTRRCFPSFGAASAKKQRHPPSSSSYWQVYWQPRSDWAKNEFNLGSTMEDNPLQNLKTGLGSWRTILPRLASDTVIRIFLKQGASVWVLRTSQIGGHDPNIAPIAPMTL